MIPCSLIGVKHPREFVSIVNLAVCHHYGGKDQNYMRTDELATAVPRYEMSMKRGTWTISHWWCKCQTHEARSAAWRGRSVPRVCEVLMS